MDVFLCFSPQCVCNITQYSNKPVVFRFRSLIKPLHFLVGQELTFYFLAVACTVTLMIPPLHHSPYFHPIPISSPLSYYLIREVIARLKRISNLGLITFFSSSLSLFCSLLSLFIPLHFTSGAPFFSELTASVSMIHIASQFSKPHRC